MTTIHTPTKLLKIITIYFLLTTFRLKIKDYTIKNEYRHWFDTNVAIVLGNIDDESIVS